jgi:hypothetical protein
LCSVMREYNSSRLRMKGLCSPFLIFIHSEDDMTAAHNAMADAQTQTLVVRKTVRSLGFSVITGLSVAKNLGTIPTGAMAALIQPQTQGIKYRSDSDAATGVATNGFKLAADETIWFDGDLSAFRMIEQAPSASVMVEFFGE